MVKLMAGEVTNENEFVAVPFQAKISWDELKRMHQDLFRA